MNEHIQTQSILWGNIRSDGIRLYERLPFPGMSTDKAGFDPRDELLSSRTAHQTRHVFFTAFVLARIRPWVACRGNQTQSAKRTLEYMTHSHSSLCLFVLWYSFFRSQSITCQHCAAIFSNRVHGVAATYSPASFASPRVLRVHRATTKSTDCGAAVVDDD